MFDHLALAVCVLHLKFQQEESDIQVHGANSIHASSDSNTQFAMADFTNQDKMMAMKVFKMLAKLQTLHYDHHISSFFHYQALLLVYGSNLTQQTSLRSNNDIREEGISYQNKMEPIMTRELLVMVEEALDAMYMAQLYDDLIRSMISMLPHMDQYVLASRRSSTIDFSLVCS